jgi:drug/metabolite transporter (DMT)-like permease
VNSRLDRLAFAALIAGATGIGFAPIFVRLSETGPSATAFYRLLFALPPLWLWALCDRSRVSASRRPSSARDFFWLAAAGLFFAGDLSVWHWSLQFTSVANSTLLTNVAPIFVTIGAWCFLNERITPGFVFGMFVAIAGAALLVGGSLQLSPRHLLGDGLSLVSAAFYSGYLLIVKRLRRSFSTPTIMAWSGLVSCPAFGLLAWISGEQLAPLTSHGWLMVVALALVSHMGGQSFIAYGFGHLPASFSSVSLLWQPVVAAVVAWPLLGEALGAMQIGGGVITLFGIALASGGWRKES